MQKALKTLLTNPVGKALVIANLIAIIYSGSHSHWINPIADLIFVINLPARIFLLIFAPDFTRSGYSLPLLLVIVLQWLVIGTLATMIADRIRRRSKSLVDLEEFAGDLDWQQRLPDADVRGAHLRAEFPVFDQRDDPGRDVFGLPGREKTVDAVFEVMPRGADLRRDDRQTNGDRFEKDVRETLRMTRREYEEIGVEEMFRYV